MKLRGSAPLKVLTAAITDRSAALPRPEAIELGMFSSLHVQQALCYNSGHDQSKVPRRRVSYRVKISIDVPVRNEGRHRHGRVITELALDVKDARLRRPCLEARAGIHFSGSASPITGSIAIGSCARGIVGDRVASSSLNSDLIAGPAAKC